jgi:hypothetical protein
MAVPVLSFVQYTVREAFMRKAILGIAIAAGLAASFLVGTASADPYKWCAIYGGRSGGASNCGFVTFEQCQATVSGIGGFCTVNQFYTGPAERPAKRARKRQRD